MGKRVLVMGLPGSGKSYLSSILASLLNGVWLNADQVREEADDWDFSLEGRLRQAKRMKKLSLEHVSAGKHVVADFICPNHSTRSIFSADFIVFMNTIKSGRYKDTNEIFVPPEKPDFESIIIFFLEIKFCLSNGTNGRSIDVG